MAAAVPLVPARDRPVREVRSLLRKM